MSELVIKNAYKAFDSLVVVDHLNIHIPEGCLLTLLGPSGCGKSTLLRCIAGLETLDEGQILLGGSDITHTAPQRRGIGMVFQNYALFPNMTAAQNIAFGLKMHGCESGEAQRRVAEAIALVELAGKENQYPAKLSGGQRQRVALARALVVRPRILLLDEPLSALDARIRKSLRSQIRDIQKELQLTTIFVTHDQEEALAMSDQVVLLNQGRIEQHTSPEELYSRPASEFAAGFIGNYNMGSLHVFRQNGHHSPQAVRPETIQISLENGDIPGTIQTRTLLGSVVRYRVHTAHDDVLNVDVLNHGQLSTLSEGMAVFLSIPAAAVIALAPAH